MPQIIPTEQWQAVQDEMDKRKHRNAHYKAKSFYLLSGLVYCGGCGGTMAGETHRYNSHGKAVEYRYYRCAAQHRQHDGGGGGAPLCTQPLGKEDGADGSGGDIHDVVADEDGGEKLVVLLGHRQHPGGGSVALLSAAFQTYLVQGRKCGLGGGEECGKRDQNDQRHQERYTAIVHNKG